MVVRHHRRSAPSRSTHRDAWRGSTVILGLCLAGVAALGIAWLVADRFGSL